MRFFAVPFVLFLLSACIKTTDVRGYTIDDSALSSIEQGKSDQRSVLEALGSPSSTSNFGKETWYYISSTSEHVAFLRPKTVKQRVIAITFNDTGHVMALQEYTEEDFRTIALSDDTTPTSGNELGVAEQLIGNIGRFNPQQGNRAAQGTRGDY